MLRTRSSTFPLIEGSKFVLYGELTENNEMFLHTHWKEEPKMTKALYKELLQSVAKILTACKMRGISDLQFVGPVTLQKYGSMFGFEPIQTFNLQGGELMIHMSQPTRDF